MGDAGTTATGHVLVWLRPVRGEVATATLDAVERARLASFDNHDTRRAYAAAHRLVRSAVSDVVWSRPERLTFDRTCPTCGAQHGRPVLTSDPTLSVSLSRTDEWVAVAISRDGPVGIDVESVTRTDFAGFADVALHPSERHAVEGRAIDGRLRRRATAWVRKEAALKALGLGLTLDPALLRAPPSGIRTVVGGVDETVTVLDLVTRESCLAGAVALVGGDGPITVEYR